jgi:hypothetical protein
MRRQAISDQTADELAHQLSANFPARLVRPESVKRGSIPKSFSPDRIFEQDGDYIFAHALATGEIPQWVIKSARTKKQRKRNKIVLLASQTEESTAVELASAVAHRAESLGFGLAIQTNDGTFLVFAPHFKKPTPAKSKNEVGHIPAWLYQRALYAANISPWLREILTQFCSKYQHATSGSEISYNRECRLLTDLSESIADSDPRLFYPLDRLQALRAYERGGANAPARDHFFHTFNNFFIGLVLLDELLDNRNHHAFPDRLISRSHRRSRLNLWESLWFLTAMFHDPGYIPENFWSLVSFAIGVEHQPGMNTAIPAEVAERIKNAWNTEFLRARANLCSTYCTIIGAKAGGSKPITKRKGRDFDAAARIAYFNGSTTGHSLISGLTLIHLCESDNSATHHHFDKATALSACSLASLSMLFHDQHCRNTLLRNKIDPISFERLPYACALMFADALQDDRRDRKISKFPKHGVLESIQMEPSRGLVTASVSLSKLELDLWPAKIAEYESIMAWINSRSGTKFIIDYRN